jgi:predicted metal-binding membrane protein
LRAWRARLTPGRAAVLTALTVAGYLGAWIGFGLLAWLLDDLVRTAFAAPLRWSAGGPFVAGGALAVAGVYQLTPAKHACLRRCRSPLVAILRGFDTRPRAALRLGAVNGAWCIGCCAGLMAVLFALGSMSASWMVLVAAAIAAEKLLRGVRVGRALAACCIVGRAVIALHPSVVPRPPMPPSLAGADQNMVKMRGGGE